MGNYCASCDAQIAEGAVYCLACLDRYYPEDNPAAPRCPRGEVALVEVDGREVEMVFLSNNLEWSAESIVELYHCRWEIEVFFKQIKQTLQIADFLGHSANAVRWQVWMALLTYILLRYLSHLSKWSHSFTRLFTVTRAVLWRKIDLLELLRGYGTAGGHYRHLATPVDGQAIAGVQSTAAGEGAVDEVRRSTSGRVELHDE